MNRIHSFAAVLLTVFTMAVIAGTTGLGGPDGPGGVAAPWPPLYQDKRLTTETQAEACCQPGARVALACERCKTVNEKAGTDKASVMAWFKPESKHGCRGCDGQVTVTAAGVGKGLDAQMKHTCSKCGEGSAFVCGAQIK